MCDWHKKKREMCLREKKYMLTSFVHENFCKTFCNIKKLKNPIKNIEDSQIFDQCLQPLLKNWFWIPHHRHHRHRIHSLRVDEARTVTLKLSTYWMMGELQLGIFLWDLRAAVRRKLNLVEGGVKEVFSISFWLKIMKPHWRADHEKTNKDTHKSSFCGWRGGKETRTANSYYFSQLLKSTKES